MNQKLLFAHLSKIIKELCDQKLIPVIKVTYSITQGLFTQGNILKIWNIISECLMEIDDCNKLLIECCDLQLYATISNIVREKEWRISSTIKFQKQKAHPTQELSRVTLILETKQGYVHMGCLYHLQQRKKLH